MTEQALNEMAHKILDAAEHLTQTRGFNGFSYKDIQAEVGIKTASIHYYFPTKQDLAIAMANRYVERYGARLSEIESQPINSIDKLKAMAEPFVQAAGTEHFCLCGMLAAEILTMPDVANQHLRHFFRMNEAWIANVIMQGMNEGDFRKELKPKSAAAHFLAALEGGLLISRTRQDAGYIQAVFDQALAQLMS